MDPKDEELIDVGDGLEKEVEIELEEDNASIQANDDNPNVSDQLQGASGENDNPEQDNRWIKNINQKTLEEKSYGAMTVDNFIILNFSHECWTSII